MARAEILQETFKRIDVISAQMVARGEMRADDVRFLFMVDMFFVKKMDSGHLQSVPGDGYVFRVIELCLLCLNHWRTSV